MFDPASRYHNLETLTLTRPDGSNVAYIARRFCPAGETLPLLTTRQVRAGDRLDNLAASQLGNPLDYWRIVDANDAMNPRELLQPLARQLRIPVPEI
jgi:hypothetical protein